MTSRPFKREHTQGYPTTPRAPLAWTATDEDGDDDEEYDPHQRRYSAAGSEYSSSLSYATRSPITTTYDSYGYPAPTTSQPQYPSQYGYANQHYSASYSQPYPGSDTRSLTAYRPQYPNTQYTDEYSPTHTTTPAITYTHAPPINTSTGDWNTSYNGHDEYGTSNGNPQSGYDMTNGMTRTASQRSDGNRSQGSSEGKERRFVCKRCTNDDTECSAAFARKADLSRHIDCVHDKKPLYGCPVRNCSRKGDQGFTRRDHRTEHLRHFHHRVIPKRPRGNQHMDEEDDDDVPC